VNVASIKRKFYASRNSLLVRCSSVAEPVEVQLIKSYCLPLITYCIGALELNSRAISELALCWNDAFRKIFHFNRFDSVKQLQYFCESIDLRHIYDLARIKCVSDVCRKLPYMYILFTSLELQYLAVNRLSHYYVGATKLSFVEAVYEHFRRCAFDAHNLV